MKKCDIVELVQILHLKDRVRNLRLKDPLLKRSSMKKSTTCATSTLSNFPKNQETADKGAVQATLIHLRVKKV